MRDTEANEWDGVHITYYGVRYDAASEELHIAFTRNINTIHQINSDALQTTQNSHWWWFLNNMTIIEFLGTLNQPYMTLSLEERFLVLERVCVGIAVLLLRCSYPSLQLAPCGHIVHDRKSHEADATTNTSEITIFSHQWVLVLTTLVVATVNN